MLGYWRSIKYILTNERARKRIPLLITILTISTTTIATFVFIRLSDTNAPTSWLERWLMPAISLATFSTTLILWFHNAYTDMMENLPKKLTSIFTYEDNPIIICNKAYLAGESDIRQWGQQLGKQMMENEYLEFSPDIDVNWTIEEEAGRGYKLYTVKFILNKIPTYINKLKEKASDSSFPFLVWNAPEFGNKPKGSLAPFVNKSNSSDAPKPSTVANTRVLTVRFTDEKGVEAMRCEHAALVHESDALRWGLELGCRMVQEPSLDIYPDFEMKTTKEGKNEEVILSIRLKSLPAAISEFRKNQPGTPVMIWTSPKF